MQPLWSLLFYLVAELRLTLYSPMDYNPAGSFYAWSVPDKKT